MARKAKRQSSAAETADGAELRTYSLKLLRQEEEEATAWDETSFSESIQIHGDTLPQIVGDLQAVASKYIRDYAERLIRGNAPAGFATRVWQTPSGPADRVGSPDMFGQPPCVVTDSPEVLTEYRRDIAQKVGGADLFDVWIAVPEDLEFGSCMPVRVIRCCGARGTIERIIPAIERVCVPFSKGGAA